MTEEWKTCGKHYEVSNLGRVRSLARVIRRSDGKIQTFKSKVLRPGSSVTGYQGVIINAKMKQVHRLVALAFIPNPESKRCVNHIDGDKTNNCVLNLEWATHAENMKHASENGLAKGGSMPGESHPESKHVRVIRSSSMSHVSNNAMGRLFDVSGVLVGLIRRRKAWKHV